MDDAISYTFTSSIKQCTLWIAPDLLERVFFNLLSNAFKFTPEGGSVRIGRFVRITLEMMGGFLWRKAIRQKGAGINVHATTEGRES